MNRRPLHMIVIGSAAALALVAGGTAAGAASASPIDSGAAPPPAAIGVVPAATWTGLADRASFSIGGEFGGVAASSALRELPMTPTQNRAAAELGTTS